MPVWKIILLALLIVAVLFINYWFITHAKGEEQECWILCQPDSWVYARMNPSKKSQELGRLECGDKVYTDGKTKNGFLHIYGLWFELDEGWVKKGYVVFDEPYRPFLYETNISSNGRVMARKTIDGKRRCWLKDGQAIKVYMMTDEWAVTNKGFVKSRFIDIGK
jgi:hypothetical protein